MKKHENKQKAVKDVMAEHGLDFVGRNDKPIKSTTIHVFEVPERGYADKPPVKGEGRIIDPKKEAEK